MFIRIPDAVIPITVDGSSDGYVTIDVSTHTLYPGTVVNLFSPGAGSLECLVTEVKDDGKVGLRGLPQTSRDIAKVNYGRTDVSAWTVVGGAKLFVEKQIIPMQPLSQPKPV